jgi:hypothetical protein
VYGEQLDRQRVEGARSEGEAGAQWWRGRWRSGSGFACTRGVQGAGDDSGRRLEAPTRT